MARKPSGVNVHVLPFELFTNYNGYHIGIVYSLDGSPYLICNEGVGQPLPANIREDLVTGEVVPLEKFIREFGSRLESNYFQWMVKLTSSKDD